jgi:hypothetical protein
MRERSSLAAVVAVALLGAACQQILGIKDVTVGASDAGEDVPVAPGGDGSAPDGRDAAPSADAARDGAAPNDGASPDAASADTAPDAPTCIGAAMACAGMCINPATSAQHCGVCNHPCGGGMCVGGVCQPTTVIDGMRISDIAVDASSLYFTTGVRVLACPKAGCGALLPRQIADMPMDTGLVKVGNGGIFFISAPGQTTTRPTLFICPIAGCPTPVPMVSSPGFSGPSEVVLVGNDVYWLDPDGGMLKRTCGPNGGACPNPSERLFGRGTEALAVSATEVFFADTMANGLGVAKCPNTGCPVAPALPTKLTTLITPTESIFFEGQLYLVNTKRPEVPEGSIQICTPTDCNAGTPRPFVNGRAGPSNLVIDRTGLYWLEVTDASVMGDFVYSIRTCPITGCVGGPRLLAANVKARSLVVDDSFVYWINGPRFGPATITPVMRVAK